MPAIGITGGISTGKTTFCQCLREILPAARFFDADAAARKLSDSDPAVQDEIKREFGPNAYSAQGHLNRRQIRATILESAVKRRALEQILHPRIRRQWSVEAQTHHNSSDFFFADIPLLYETGGETLCDAVVVVACSPELQMARLLQRPGLREEEATRLIKSQMSLDEKVRRADHVVWNNGGRAVVAEQARLLIEFWRANGRRNRTFGIAGETR